MKTTQRHTIATLYRKIVSAHSNLFAYDERKELKNIFIKFSNQVSPKEQNIEKTQETTIKTEEDVEKATGLMVLTSIPDYNIENNRKKGGRR